MGAHQSIIDCHTHVGISIGNYLGGAYPYAMSVEDIVVRMRHLGISRSVVFPIESSYYIAAGGGSLAGASAFPYEKENISLFKEVFETFPEYTEMLIPFAMFDPSRKTKEQAGLLDELHREYGVCGLKTVTSYTKAFVKDFQKKGNPIRSFARKHRLPLTFHCSWLKTDPWANVFDVLDIVRENPELNICVAHSARFSMKALEIADDLPNCFVDSSAFKIHCDLAASDSPSIPPRAKRFPADYRSPATVFRSLVESYPETIIWGSDTPYHYFIQKFEDAKGKVTDVRLTSSYDAELRILKALPAAMIKKTASGNTEKFLNNIKKRG